MVSDTIDSLKDRRSIREYSPKKVPRKILNSVLEAARWAPSAHNAQPWRFVVIKDTSQKLRLANAMAEHWKKDLAKNGFSRKKSEDRIKDSVERFSRTPTLIVACLTMAEMNRYPDKRRQRIERIMAVQSVAVAIQNILLAAHIEGLGACWFCAPLFCPETVKKVLKIPSDLEPQALITMGYPVNRPSPQPRKPLDEIMRLDGWKEMR
jgi:F420 biosynthesis protein FbiB-like protein